MKLTDYETETGHRQWYCRQGCGGCYICEGGLFHCRVCGQAEAELEKRCPGKPINDTNGPESPHKGP